MDASLRVFVVDDDQIILDVLSVALDGVCELEKFASAEAV
jgi:CheY-like chemotaxis protein